MIDGKAEKYYSWSPYVYAINNPIKFLDSDGNDIDLSYLISESHKQAFNTFMSTTEGSAFIAQYMPSGTYNLNGISYTFNSTGSRAKDILYLQSTDEQGSVNMNSGAVRGLTRAFTKDFKTELQEASEKTDISNGIAEVITLNSDMGANESTAVLGHEAFVHGQSDANRLNSIDMKEAMVAYEGKTAQKLKDIRSVGASGDRDHSDLAKNGNKAYENYAKELDKKKNTTYYNDYYKNDREQYK